METSSLIQPQRDSPAVLAALAVLVVLAIASPWPFGSAHPLAVQAITLVALGTALGVTVTQAWRGHLIPPSFPVWPLLSLLALGAFQLLPLPPSLHAVLAPGSHSIWHPAEPAAAAVLGPGWRPVSIFPEATRRWLGFTVGLVTLAVLAGPALGYRRRAFRAALVVSAGGLAVALYGIIARTLLGSLLYGRIVVPTVAPFGPFVSKNHFAGYVEMAALLTLGLATGLADEARRGPSVLGWIESRRAGRVVLACGAAATMALAVLVSLSRGGVVSLAVGVLAFVALRLLVRRRTPARGRIVGMVGVLAIVAFSSFTVLPREGKDRILSLTGITSDQSGAFRLAIWRDTLRLVASSPLVGHGLGAYEDALPRFKTAAGELRVQHAENDYLEILAEGGGLGLLVALAGALLVISNALRKMREEEDRLLRGIGLGATAGVVALLVHSGFDFNLRIPSNSILFALLLALGLAGGSAKVMTFGGTGRWALPLALGVALAAGGWLAHSSPPAPVSFTEVSPSSLRRLQMEAALVSGLHRRPGDAELWWRLGWLRLNQGASKEALSLATYAARLEPARPQLQEGASRLASSASSVAPP